MSIYLTSNADNLKSKFFSLQTPMDVADLLDVSYKDFNYYLYRLSSTSKYQIIEVAKRSGGSRQIRVPIASLKIIQAKLHTVLKLVYKPKPATHGFVAEKSIVTNADAHLQHTYNYYVLNIDLKDFFPSINFGRVRGLFLSKPFELPSKVATVLAQICCIDNQLPQGAPTSPIIANMICARLDQQLQSLARETRCFYTRYADDITFSTTQSRFPQTVAIVEVSSNGRQIVPGDRLTEIIESNGFKINVEKVRLQSRDRRQEVTGLIVNRKVNVTREYYSQVRAMLHAWERYGLDEAEREHFEKWDNKHRSLFSQQPSYASILRGKIEYIGMVRGKQNRRYRNLLRQFGRLDANFSKTGLVDMREQIFISYSHKDSKHLDLLKKHLKPLERDHKLSVWDDTQIKASAKWRQEIETALNTATAAILLVSGNFLASDFIAKHELPPLLKAAEQDGLKIFWIPVSSSMVEHTPISDYHALISPKTPLDKMSAAKRNEAIVNICTKILELGGNA